MNERTDKVSFATLPEKESDAIQDEVGEHTDEENDDDPRLSAAALCISFHFLPACEKNGANSFGPEYTHQCFEGEFIPGYQPFERDILSKFMQLYAPETRPLGSKDLMMVPRHASHVHFKDAQEYLRIKIEVAPSCAVCRVLMETRAKLSGSSLNPDENYEYQFKRRRIGDSSEESEGKSISHGAKGENDEETTKQMKDQSKGSTSKISKAEVLERLKNMLPDIVENRNMGDEYLTKPFGELLHEYEKDNGQYVLTLASGKRTPHVESYHKSIQRLALGWIETADYVDVAYQPHAGQYWQILYLFQKHGDDKFSLAGYMTLWIVTSLLARPQPGLILRITQALLLPHQQRRGHGQEMMKVIYQLAHGKFDSILKNNRTNGLDLFYPIVQVNVEDPSPGFTSMRDLVDYKMFLENEEWKNLLLSGNTSKGDPTLSSQISLDECTLTEIAAKAKLTPRQVQIVHELLQLRLKQVKQKQLTKSAVDSLTESIEDDDGKALRLLIKERLYKENKSIITSLSSKDEMREELSDLFSQVMDRYEQILARVHHD